MIYSPVARRQITALRQHYEKQNRTEALMNLEMALGSAEAQIERVPAAGLPAPRPYPELAHPGEAWIKVGRYWISYRATAPSVILTVFYDAADIPGRS